MASDSHNGSGWPQVTFVALAVLAVGLVFLWPYLGGSKATTEGAATAPQRTSQAAADGHRAGLIQAAAEAAEAAVSGRWEMIVERARAAAAAGPDQLRLFVWTLFTAFDAMESTEQEGALRAFFESGRDVRFSEVFTVGRGGWLMDWPTLRVALFDYVAQRDRKLAHELAITLLQARPDEPGEWSLALRELVRGHTTAEWSSLVRVRVQEFIHDPEWSARGSASWMEGFDVLVAGGTAEPLKDLSDLSGTRASRTSRFVAFLTADRLVLAAPAACLTALNDDASLFAGSTGVRAGLFARADVRDPAQRAQLERYFARGDVGPGERAQFAAAFPQLNAAPTHRLLTEPAVRSATEVRAVELSSLAHLREWIDSGRYPDWAGTFAEVHARLTTRGTAASTAPAPVPEPAAAE
ncbi:MAG: hypothetical protein IAE82_10385 [Opitutaceae bacterium]|nr:hypothetical protein [Opitutaceae bacterium]